MKNARLYRAATLREALEQIKDELGEDALVLGHKKVRAGGILGIGAREMVEVLVATDAEVEKRRTTSRPAVPVMPENPIAVPERGQAPKAATRPGLTESQPGSILAALASRAYADNEGLQADAPMKNGAPEPPRAARETPKSVPVMPATTAPAPAPEPAPVRASSVMSELNRMRMELREMKLSLCMVGRTPGDGANHRQPAADFESDPEIYDSPYFESYMGLIESGLQQELARKVMLSVVRSGEAKKTVKAALSDSLDSVLRYADEQDYLRMGAAGAKVASTFVGPTGVGKTTTIAKLAAHAALSGRGRVELITLDTYRIAAADQLKRYAEIIGAGFHIARSVPELDQIIRSITGKARIFIDTAGRSPNDLADQLELADYLRGSRDIHKCLVLQATTHPSDAMIAVKKFALFGPEHLVITKLDETVRPGAAVGIAMEADLPVAYLCAGQRVPDDIERASSTNFAAQILRGPMLAATVAA